ncbi:FAD:protein FMN transferase [Terrilactibacillus sp. S3-3]|nr:FAD:protein FMN transferase [Terrilactibacillus sp. S3-3]
MTQLLRHPKKRIKASPLLFQAIKFGLEVARETNGLFDPTIGRQMEKRGFNENYLSGEKMDSTFADGTHPSYKDVILNESDRTVYLKKPLVIDLGAIAKGMAIDLAAKVLKPFPGFIVDAGGDIYAGGKNERNRPWRIGIKHPIKPAEVIVIGSIGLSDAAICTSGSYERISPLISNEHHLFNPLIGGSPSKMVSCTVIAPFAILADAFSTASFVMGVPRGLEQMKKMHLGGLMITSSLNLYMTDQFKETWLWKKV